MFCHPNCLRSLDTLLHVPSTAMSIMVPVCFMFFLLARPSGDATHLSEPRLLRCFPLSSLPRSWRPRRPRSETMPTSMERHLVGWVLRRSSCLLRWFVTWCCMFFEVSVRLTFHLFIVICEYLAVYTSGKVPFLGVRCEQMTPLTTQDSAEALAELQAKITSDTKSSHASCPGSL